ncbi:MAG: TVP38/TMEM64 family protein [Mariprofundaceae bacterium]
MNIVKRTLPLLLLLVVIVLFFAFDLGRFFGFEALREHRQTLLELVEAYPFVAPFTYVVLYIAVVAFSLPGGLVMTLSGGLLFGAVAGGLYAVTGATLGATAIFLIAKTSLGDFLLARAGNGIRKMQKGFAENALSYMFILRLVPIFPFFLVNLAPAFLGVSLRIYLLATFFGIMPATFIYALAGSGLGSVFDRGETLSAAGILTPEMMGALAGLALLALLPVIYKKFKKVNNSEGDGV